MKREREMSGVGARAAAAEALGRCLERNMTLKSLELPCESVDSHCVTEVLFPLKLSSRLFFLFRQRTW